LLDLFFAFSSFWKEKMNHTFEEEGGFADATGAVENERLRDAVVLGVVV
jgi:hypothetical protein